ncbi:Cytosol non-specific dipeptidase [Halioglobus japonicus]|nr:Cytosol non-specific dipeptidase [Halioglobus japonicus]
MKPANYPADPAHLWRHFYNITQIPRPSGQEAAVRQYIIAEAEQAGYATKMDDEGNLVVAVPASEGMAGRETVIIQNHLDMVTVKTADKAHDFSRDPLALVVEDGWLRADRTTLGADNGVGCAAALALMTDPQVQRPPLELLFTVDEETGLGGALRLDPELLTGTRMLNLDTEEWQELYVGCTGGGGWEFHRSFATAAPSAQAQHWTLAIKGLAGGHSGIQIHQQLGNAIKLLGQCLQGLEGGQLAALDVGVAHNVIPREGAIGFTCPQAVSEQLQVRVEQVRQEALGYLPEADKQLEFVLQPSAHGSVLGAAESAEILDMLAVFPHGVQAYSLALGAELVDLSTNLAMARLQQGEFMLESSYRFFNAAQSLPLQHSVMALARAYRLTVKDVVGYPGWQPDLNSPLLAQASALHERLFGGVPAVKAIHAGLECGILKGKKTDLDILSFGPTIQGAHSPTERLQINTVKPFWQFLTALLAQM